MKAERFITPALSGWLDLIRLAAAVCVVIGHTHLLGVYTGYYPFSYSFELNAVVVFFVLSGLVIATSAHNPDADWRSYVAARVARILPCAWTALALAYAAAWLCHAFGQEPRVVGMDTGDLSPLHTLRAALFLDQSYFGGFSIDPPWWSLAYEVWFYVLFGLGMWLRGWRRWVAISVAALIAGTNVLLLFPVWLVGVALARVPAARRFSKPGGVALIILALFALEFSVVAFNLLEPLTFAVASLYPGHSQFALGYLALALFIAGGFAGLRALVSQAGVLPPPLLAVARWGADVSFSLYLIHWPLLTLLNLTGLTAGDSMIGFTAVLVLALALATIFTQLVERRRRALRVWIEARLRASQRIRTSSSDIEGCKATV